MSNATQNFNLHHHNEFKISEKTEISFWLGQVFSMNSLLRFEFSYFLSCFSFLNSNLAFFFFHLCNCQCCFLRLSCLLQSLLFFYFPAMKLQCLQSHFDDEIFRYFFSTPKLPVASEDLALEYGDPKLIRLSVSELLDRRPGTKGSWSSGDIMRSLFGLAEPTNDMSLSPIESSPYDRCKRK